MNFATAPIEEIISDLHAVRQQAVDDRHKSNVFNSKKRRELAEAMSAELQVPEEAAYLKLSESDFPEVHQVVEQGIALKDKANANGLNLKRRKKKYSLLDERDYQSPEILESPLFRLARNPQLISTLSAYLGYVPILTTATFWYNPNSSVIKTEQDIAQFGGTPTLLSHLDWADNRLLKVFIHCSPVTAKNGALQILNPQNSDVIRDRAHYRYFQSRNTSTDPYQTNGIYLQDDVIETLNGGKPHYISLTGEAGTVYLVDTARCFHYGGRNTDTSQERLLAILLYLRPGALKLATKHGSTPPFRHLSNASLPLVDRLLLGEEV